MAHRLTRDNPAGLEFGRIVCMNLFGNADLYRSARDAAEHGVRRQIAECIAAAGITPPADDDMPVTWLRVPTRDEFELGDEYREEPVTDDTVIDDGDMIVVRVEGLLERADDGRTVLAPTADGRAAGRRGPG